MHRSLRILSALALVVFLAPNAFAQCLTGTSSAELMTDGPHVGLWKYCIAFSWDTPLGLSNVVLDFEFPCANGICDATWDFDMPAGTVDGVASDSGTPGECTNDVEGYFTCDAIPGLGLQGPLVKWDAISTIDPPCEPGMTGSGMVCYYSDLPPAMDQEPMFIVKNGTIQCQGTITGDFPSCPVPVDEIKWSEVKTLYRD
jgi:hypothetical protein